ncbi:Regulator of nucleoside diphosphate kinase [Roseovarius sp. EC-HK134]|jgi:regulator of nucleoside diphosphate kinase|uniref:nucleoside diphosphate kinase regulator n=1 Tax=unclassified Roseovarius TaxID=2614913 RepID=UPI00125542CC|nr:MULTISPECIES: nucleoside diphosphate kinase regulator [unclassified Roseovarius]VVS98087.1 Regulator of nucleoside diphosphate kinase [Roseovarius sp. EC-SD190]VVS99401.1 Regulator of nucleoside diphosphate kinase [Roseovarius sp. EC-HK134]
MQKSMTQSNLLRRRPRLDLCQEDFNILESLAEGGFRRNPDLANRLFDELDRARIVPAKKLPPHAVSLGRTVTYRDETTAHESTVRLVLPEDADISQQRVSVMTPIGVALIGLSEGAVFHWQTLEGERRALTVLRVASGNPEDELSL